MKHLKYILFSPAVVTMVLLTLLVVIMIADAGGNILVLPRLGTRFSDQDPNGTEGYDGQFIYYIARNPDPTQVAPYLDVPAYRYQRILLPLVVRVISFGNIVLIPWILALVGILSQAAGTWIVSRLLEGWGVNRWYALIYGLFAGFVLAVRLALPEPLAYALVTGAILAVTRKRIRLAWVLYGLALFAKEVTILFVIAQLISSTLERNWRNVAGLILVTFLPFFMFQLWLWDIYGQPGIASGGAMATPFEVIPYMGLWRIREYSLGYLLAMMVVFVPAIVLPSLWGVWKSLTSIIKGERNMIVLALLVNATIIAFLPFSTFRETGGLLRFACGLVLATVLYTGLYRLKRALNYSALWIVLNVFLLKS